MPCIKTVLRDIDLLKQVSRKSGVHMICSTGFYYTDEPVLYRSSVDVLADHYVEQIARYGCFIGLDRLHNITSEEYITRKVNDINYLCEKGYSDRVLLSHDAPFFSGFQEEPLILERPRLPYCFDHILPRISKQQTEEFMITNPLKMLRCGD